jgi:hypothetical protein
MRNNRWIHPVTGWAALAAALLLSACAGKSVVKPSSWHLPWHKTAAAAPVAVTELAVLSEASVPLTVLQYWSRNTLRVDLGSFSGSGSLRLLPSPVNGWPARLEFAVRPGSMSQLEVQGDQRAVFAVSEATVDGGLQTLPVAPTVYSAATTAIVVSWN